MSKECDGAGVSGTEVPDDCDQQVLTDDEDVAEEENEEPRLHDLEAGDHIVRWTHIALYPVQVHGVVLSAGPDIVTLVDFGLASQSKSSSDRKVGPSSTAEAASDSEAREVTKAAGGGDRRLEIITITDEKDIRRWRKVNYGAKVPGESKLKRLMSSMIPGGGKAAKAEKAAIAKAVETDGGDTSTNDDDEKTAKGGVSSKAKETKMEMPDSDPKGVVLARVRYLLENENIDEKENHCNSALPPYHIFNANSECIAVWVKTGRFSTLQAAIFLHSTALGQVKSAATLSLFVASQTVPVTTTVSAGGVLGWFGMTTTSTALVPMLSASPWLIPALATYGLAAVGTPYLILMKAKGKWEESTTRLNDGFWGEWAGPDVFVDAIKGWSGMSYDD